MTNAGLRAALLLACVMALSSGGRLRADTEMPQERWVMLDELRQMSKTVRSGLTDSEAGALGAVLATQNLVARTMSRQLRKDMADRLGQYLAAKQLEWQADRSTGKTRRS